MVLPGIGPSASTSNVLVFTDPPVGALHGYFDRWEGNVLHFTGEGQHGDQENVQGNKAISDVDCHGGCSSPQPVGVLVEKNQDPLMKSNRLPHPIAHQKAGPLSRDPDGVFTMTNAVAIEPGRLDRSPTGTGLSARMAVLRARGDMEVGDRLRMRSVIGSEFEGLIESDTTVGGRPAIVPLVSGRASRTSRITYSVDPTDPWPRGYRLTDTWPRTSD